MTRARGISLCLVAAWMAPAVVLAGAESAPVTQEPAPAGAARSGIDGKLVATVGKSLIIDSPLKIEKISVANGDLVEAVAINPQEVLINGKLPGETSLIVWQQGGRRLVYDLTVRISPLKLEGVRQQISRDFPNENINVSYDNNTVFVRGTVPDMLSANRVLEIASTLGKPMNLLRVAVAPSGPEVLLKVKFATIDLSAERDLGFSLLSNAFNQQSGITPSQTGLTSAVTSNSGVGGSSIASTVSLSSVAQILLFRKDINLAAAIQAFEDKNLAEILAEPNLLTTDGQEASFLSGGSFPIPVVQAGAAAGAITVMYEEYGIKLKFLPVITPRSTIRMRVAPEYSVIDPTTSVEINGFSIPGLKTQKTEATIELESGQSFVIAGLMDRSLSDNLQKIPGLSSIPLLGKLFQSKTWKAENSELLVIVTPELVRPIKPGQPLPELSWREPFMKPISPTVQQPGLDKTGPPVELNAPPIPYEQMLEQMKKESATSAKGLGTPPSLAPAVQPETSDQQPANPNPATPPAASAPAPTKQ
ncbi:MAG: type II and III secretion system protein family protein [Bryobacteraceae bacterium]